ncbi:beta-1,3-galactosyltransferase 5-like isoform X2 [Daphnia pulicaria]|nr:beta-1,3-galactosyltransferase 5-like isoform X2 [Daphnia pulicaria]
MKNSNLEILDHYENPEEENPVVITSILYETGHNMPFNDVCPRQGEGMKLMILVTSAAGHASQRNTVRSTWGSVAFRRDIGLAFMLGISKNSSINEQIERENLLYGDIIQGMFVDTYNNLTLKTISALEWSWTYCSRVKYVLKTDDDVYIHMPVLLAILDEVVDRRRTILGHLAKSWKPFRDIHSPYYVSKTRYKENKYPNFHTGPAYVLTSDIVEHLYRAALNETFFKLEDIFITGMIANNLPNIEHHHYPQFLNSRPKYDEIRNTCAMAKLAAVHMLRKEEIFDLWRRLSDGQSDCYKH